LYIIQPQEATGHPERERASERARERERERERDRVCVSVCERESDPGKQRVYMVIYYHTKLRVLRPTDLSLVLPKPTKLRVHIVMYQHACGDRSPQLK
jgi:hypothetical protein